MEGLRNHSEAMMNSGHSNLNDQGDGETRPLNPMRLLSRNEVQANFGIPKRFLELAVSKNTGPAFVKIGRLTRYRVQDVEAWIAKNRYERIGLSAAPKNGA